MVVKKTINGEKKYVVYKQGSDGRPTGKALGTHDEPKKAYAQIKAIKIHSKES